MTTINLPIEDSQLVEWVRQLPPESKQRILQALIPHFDIFEGLVDRGEDRIRKIAANRGVDWDLLSEEKRLSLIDEILHES